MSVRDVLTDATLVTQPWARFYANQLTTNVASVPCGEYKGQTAINLVQDVPQLLTWNALNPLPGLPVQGGMQFANLNGLQGAFVANNTAGFLVPSGGIYNLSYTADYGEDPAEDGSIVVFNLGVYTSQLTLIGNQLFGTINQYNSLGLNVFTRPLYLQGGNIVYVTITSNVTQNFQALDSYFSIVSAS